MSPPKYEQILVPLDGSDDAEVALRTAKALAAKFVASVHTLSVGRTPGDIYDLRTRAAHALGVDRDDERVHTLISSNPAQAINDRADDLASCLVCMTSCGSGRLVGSVHGSVTRSVIREHCRPIVVVGRLADRKEYFETTWPEPLSVKRIVACVDDKPAADTVVAIAADWAVALEMSLTILTVAVPAVTMVRERSDEIDSSLQRLRDLARDRSVEVSTHLQYDPLGPASGVSTYLSANPAGLLVVLTHARSGLTRLLGGATAANIIAASPIATVTVSVHD